MFRWRLQRKDPQVGQLAPSFEQAGERPAATLLLINQGLVVAASGYKHAKPARQESLAWFVNIFLPHRLKTDLKIAGDVPEKIEQDQE